MKHGMRRMGNDRFSRCSGLGMTWVDTGQQQQQSENPKLDLGIQFTKMTITVWRNRKLCETSFFTANMLITSVFANRSEFLRGPHFWKRPQCFFVISRASECDEWSHCCRLMRGGPLKWMRMGARNVEMLLLVRLKEEYVDSSWH